MSERINFDTSAVASISVEDLHKIKQNVYALVHLVEKRNLTTSNREKAVLIYAIEGRVLNLKYILDI